jgi:hypothetical protein
VWCALGARACMRVCVCAHQANVLPAAAAARMSCAPPARPPGT